MSDLKPDDGPAQLPEPGDEETRESAPSFPDANAGKRPRELGGPEGPEPTRYGDWEVGGRCSDF